MPAPRRTLPLLLVGLIGWPLPACLHVSGTVTPTDTAPNQSPPLRDFATLPSRPGEVVRSTPTKSDTAKVPPSPPIPIPDPPTNHAEPVTKADPPPDSIGQTAAKIAPGTLPILPTAPPPSALEAPLSAAMRAYVENRPDRALDILKALDKPNQDVVLAMMPIVLRLSQINFAAPDPAEAAMLADQLQSLAARLEAKAALKVEHVAFCRKASGFGRYEPRPEVEPYRPNDVALLYFEVQHLVSEPTTGPRGERFVTRAHINLEVRDAHGRLVEQTDPMDWRRRVPIAHMEHTEYTRSMLHDYSRVYGIPVPAHPGVYTITVEVKDPATNRTTRSQPAEFRVAGP